MNTIIANNILITTAYNRLYNSFQIINDNNKNNNFEICVVILTTNTYNIKLE